MCIRDRTDSCRLFMKHNLNIFTLDETFFYFHCGQYPVIYITFKEIAGNSFSDVLDMFREIVGESLSEHEYLLNSTRLVSKEKCIILKDITLYSDKILYITEDRLKGSLVYLSEMLFFHFNKKVIILIDEFDTTVWKLLSKDFPLDDTHRTIHFINGFMVELLENNPYVDRGLINDCLRLSKILLKGTTSISNFHYLENHRFAKYYGLTEEELSLIHI